jgi:DNA polymerase-3 subunit chi
VKSAPSDFLAHAGPGADPQVQALSPVVLVQQAEASPHRDILLNLDETVPEGLEGFARVVEVVSLDDMDRAMARNRWKDYAAWSRHPAA